MVPHPLSVGDFALLHEPGLVRRIAFRRVEIVRMINAPVRDANWATLPTEVMTSMVKESGDRLTVEELFSVDCGALDGRLTVEVDGTGILTATIAITARQAVTTNRAGFTLLHPIAGVAGAVLTVRHANSSVEETRFPKTIAPGQPALDIAGLSYTVDGVEVDVAFDGEIFEMEDQRNWSDASFKTYCRPLSKPMPYTIAVGETAKQRITVTAKAAGGAKQSSVLEGTAWSVMLPAISLVCEPDWMGPIPAGFTPLLRFSAAEGWSRAQLETFRRSPAIDVEIVVSDGAPVHTALRAVNQQLIEAGLTAARIIALPEAYLKSYQPSGPWPCGPTPADCARAARETFDGAKIGVGMLTSFAEFNRNPPDVALGDYVTFGNTAIVHAADSLSVWETLEALPDIFASARTLSADLPLRLGLVSIGMRTNPYGAGLIANPDGETIAMTGHDPRQCLTFAAAYAVAAFALAAKAGVEAIALAAPAGRFGLFGRNGPRPINRAIRALAALGPVAEVEHLGSSVSLSSPAGRIVVRLEGDGALEIEGLEDGDGP